jgi:glycosyltransferase involved in cell wall biosynthesis
VTEEKNLAKVIVAQLGARMHYAVPAILHRAGMLAHFYTDAYVGPGSAWYLPARAARLLPEAWRPAPLKRLLDRREDSLPPEKVTAFNLLGLAYAQKLIRSKSSREVLDADLWAMKRFNKKILQTIKDVEGERVFYLYSDASTELLSLKSSNNIKFIVDQIDPSIFEERLVAEESMFWPDWEIEPSGINEDEIYEREKLAWEMADLIIVNSEFTKTALISLGADSQRIEIVPLAVNIENFYPITAKKTYSKVNFLFLGSLILRKGIQYALEAFRLIRSSNVTLTIAGGLGVTMRVEKLKEYNKVCSYIGQIPRNNVVNVYQSADVFIFPTISDGFGLTQVEAMACGLPVITTPNSGSVVRDGFDGFIVPIRDSEALAEKIELLSSDPDLLQWMSKNARQRAQEFSWKKYGERLTGVIQHALEPLSVTE